MSYHNRLILRRLLIILVILIAVCLVVSVMFYVYMGRFAVYTENGVVFRDSEDSVNETAGSTEPLLALDDAELVRGSTYENTSAADTMNLPTAELSDRDIYGLFISNAQLSDSKTVNTFAIADSEYNTYIFEIRSGNNDLKDSEDVQSLITRAAQSGSHIIAQMSCLTDSEYALAHQQQALAISGGALWMDSNASYFLDPSNTEVQEYVASKIIEVAQLGFDEIILQDFRFPDSSDIVSSLTYDERSAAVAQAFQNIEQMVSGYCRISLYVSDPSTGHQALDVATRLYVNNLEPTDLAEYYDSHSDHYLVFMTGLHDTRFDEYGKILIED